MCMSFSSATACCCQGIWGHHEGHMKRVSMKRVKTAHITLLSTKTRGATPSAGLMLHDHDQACNRPASSLVLATSEVLQADPGSTPSW